MMFKKKKKDKGNNTSKAVEEAAAQDSRETGSSPEWLKCKRYRKRSGEKDLGTQVKEFTFHLENSESYSLF